MAVAPHTSADEFILETRGLTKQFKGFVAVSNVDLRVRRGEIHALIGPNGAGAIASFPPALTPRGVYRDCSGKVERLTAVRALHGLETDTGECFHQLIELGRPCR